MYSDVVQKTLQNPAFANANAYHPSGDTEPFWPLKRRFSHKKRQDALSELQDGHEVAQDGLKPA